jgi:AcrR family transcriptional regulator
MPPPARDHRRATAERNAEAILDATERLLARRTTLSMAAIAAEAGISRVTLYAHFKGLPDVVEAAVARAVAASMAAVTAAGPGAGRAGEALERVLDACWTQLARQDALARAAGEYVPARRLHSAHERLLTTLLELVERGRQDGSFRTDLPADWLVTTIFALLHAADEHARNRRVKRSDARRMLATTVRDVFAVR